MASNTKYILKSFLYMVAGTIGLALAVAIFGGTVELLHWLGIGNEPFSFLVAICGYLFLGFWFCAYQQIKDD